MTNDQGSDAAAIQPTSFEDLIKKVHDKDICGECGGCVSFCSAADIGAIEMRENEPPHYSNQENCLHCGICYLICPSTFELDKDLNKRFDFKAPIGNYSKVLSVQASDPDIQTKGTDGGAVTATLLALLENNLIDGAIVSKQISPFQRIPFFAKNKEEILESAGTYYDTGGSSPQLGKYNTFVPIVSELKKVLTSDDIKIAVVGVPCQIHSIRKMQELKIIPAHIVEYTLGLFCYENFKFDETARARIEERFKFSFKNIEKLNIKDKLIFHLTNRDKPLEIEFNDLEDIMRNACRVCGNFSNHYADLSFGGVGSLNGYTTLLVRTKKGEEVFNLIRNKGYINIPEDKNNSIEKSKILAQVISFSKRKAQRAEAFNNK